jgi:hypothetical protein
MEASGHDYRLGLSSLKSCCERWQKKEAHPYTDTFIPERRFVLVAYRQCCKKRSYVESLYQRRTRKARSVFQRLGLPTTVSISNGIRSR